MNYLLTTYLILSLPFIYFLFHRGMKLQKVIDLYRGREEETGIIVDNLVKQKNDLLKSANYNFGLRILDMLMQDAARKNGKTSFYKDKGEKTNVYVFAAKKHAWPQAREYGTIITFPHPHFPEEVGSMLSDSIPQAFADMALLEESRRKEISARPMLAIDEKEIAPPEEVKKPISKMEWEHDEENGEWKATYSSNGRAYLSVITVGISEINKNSCRSKLIYFSAESSVELINKRYASVSNAKRAIILGITKNENQYKS